MEQVLAELSRKQPVFYSEADFQHALAWQFHLLHSNADIRLEYPVPLDGSAAYIDIVIGDRAATTAIELKYKTARTSIVHGGEQYSLRDQSAQDSGRYDFLKDIRRLEKFTAATPNSVGYAVILTNDWLYWNPPRKTDPIDKEFRVHEGRLASGCLAWSGQFKPGSVAGRTRSIALRGSYAFSWREYSSFVDVQHGRFRYLLVSVGGKRVGQAVPDTRGLTG